MNKKTHAPIVQEFMRSSGCLKLHEAVESVVSDIIRKQPCRTPFTDLETIAKSFGITEIIRCNLPCDGMLVPTSNDHYSVYLSTDTPVSRQRFSLAHEIAHAIIHHLVPDTRRFATRSVFMPAGHRDEERLCDKLAGALLMPYDWIVAQFGRQCVCPRLVQEIASYCQVSLSAAAMRCMEITETRFGMWEFTGFPRKEITVFNRAMLIGPCKNLPLLGQIFSRPSLLAEAACSKEPLAGWEWIGTKFCKTFSFISIDCNARINQSRRMIALSSSVDIREQMIPASFAL